jgi:pimeloyl-ACP methyl ester carboxylesterase
MKLTIHPTNAPAYEAYAYTGGKDFDATKPTVVFIHGVLNDHSVWILQSRYLAHHGFNVLAVDLPGHGRSSGEAPSSVEEAAQFVADLLDAAGVKQTALVGFAHCAASGGQFERAHHPRCIGGHGVSDEGVARVD